MASVHDVALYVLRKRGSTSTWKLQKLVYYSQAWHLVWEEQRLFREPIEAWPAGPVTPALYTILKGKFAIGPSAFKHGHVRNLCESQRTSIDAVLDFYGDRSGHWLTELVRMEAPWRGARDGLERNERGRRRIPLGAMNDYYGGLAASV
jgi:uncharacterized phage-associated protein